MVSCSLGNPGATLFYSNKFLSLNGPKVQVSCNSGGYKRGLVKRPDISPFTGLGTVLTQALIGL
jgi:hypothetical protein